MNSTDALRRQAVRCGYLPRVASVGGMPSRGFPVGDDGWTELCPGYTCSLPEVVETAENWQQWKERTLEPFLGEPPTHDTLHCLAVLGNAVNGHQAYRVEQRRRDDEAKRGGR